MNTTKMYEILTENENHFTRHDDYYLTEVYKELLGMIREEIAKEAEKAAGRKPNIRNAVKKFISKDDTRPVLQKAQVFEMDGKTYYGYCDGFKLAWCPIDFGFGTETERPLNVQAIIHHKFNDVIPITPELKAELKAWIKTHKKGETRHGKREAFTITYPNGNYIEFDPDFLEACIDFTEATEMITDFNANGNNPVFFYGKEDRNALCLPIRR